MKINRPALKDLSLDFGDRREPSSSCLDVQEQHVGSVPPQLPDLRPMARRMLASRGYILHTL